MKNKKYRISLVVLVSILILNLVLYTTSTVFAAKNVTIISAPADKVEGLVNDAIKARTIMAAFKKCYEKAELTYTPRARSQKDVAKKQDRTSLKEIEKNKGNLFRDFSDLGLQGDDNSDHIKIRVGSLEQSIEGSKHDGKAYCDDSNSSNITKEFVDFFKPGGSISDLFCNQKADGLFSHVKITGGARRGSTIHAEKTDNCAEGIPNGAFQRNKTTGIPTLKSIYEKRMSGNVFAEKFENIEKDNINANLDYLAALNAFNSDCVSGFEDKKTNQAASYSVKIVDKDGKVSEKYPKIKFGGDGKDVDATSFVYSNNGGNINKSKSCKDLSDILNKNAEFYAANFKTAKQDTCGSPEMIQAVTDTVTEYSRREGAGAVLTADEKAEYTKLSSALQKKDFTEDDGNGGRKCIETKKIKVQEESACGSEKTKTQARGIVEGYEHKMYDEGETLSDAEKQEYETLQKALADNKFTVDDGNGGEKCLETEHLENQIETGDSSTDDGTADEKQSYCQENGGFLSWMLCPAIADGAATAGGLLGFITSLTTVHTSIIEQFSKQDSSIYKAWSAFRNIANIGFVIMLLVVVFSQVTNIGISNYNIKKILPKLIITAILVNFSYLIMGVLIDLSQIAGNGIGALIRSVAADGMDADASTRASAIISAIAGSVTGVAGGLAGIGVATGALAGPAIILPVVMFIVTTLISVFFGFIMLTIRQAAIIMVVVLAPLMMVLYALPNTAAITKKYLSIVKSLLMLYPMFIFATSAGALASSIIIGTSTDILMMIVGGLLNVLPYFAIPSMTSKSLAGLGAITGAFDKMRGGALKGASMAGGAIASSEFYRNAKNNFAADREVKRAEEKLRGYNNMRRSGKTLTSGQMRDRARAVEILNKDSKMRAGGDYAASTALSNFSGSGFENLENLAKDEAMEYQDKILMSSYRNSGKSEAELAAELKKEMETSYKGATDQQKEAHDSRIRALTRVVGATKSGQKLINGMMADSSLKTSGRAMTQLDHASSSIPGFADKHQVLSGQLTSLRGTSQAAGEDTVEGLANQLRAEGTEFALSNINGDKLNAMSNADASELKATGDARFNAALNQLAETGIKNPDIINGLDGAKYEMVHEAQGEIADRMNQTTINVRSTGNEAAVYRAPADFGEIASQRVVNGDVVYTNKNGDTFNASKNQTTKNL
ncbi:MAG: MFS transporter [Candidatus Nanosynbacter sp.]|nr:MFS transporter [Candidatus Nanosynbacter sp.]